jgi:hypothetical protein
MTKLLRATLIAFMALALTTTTVLGAITIVEGSMDNRRCVDDPTAGRFITGTITVEAGSTGTLILSLQPKIGGATQPVVQTESIPLVAGTLTYDFTFENVPKSNGSGTFTSYLITTNADNAERANSIDVEVECKPGVVPEAPFALLLVVTSGLVTVGLVATRMRRAAQTVPA